MVKDNRHKTSVSCTAKTKLRFAGVRRCLRLSGRSGGSARFSIDYHRKVRGRALTRSVLDDIEGVGEKRKAALLAHFGSVERIKAASVEELASAPSMNRAVANAVYQHFATGAGGTDSKG